MKLSTMLTGLALFATLATSVTACSSAPGSDSPAANVGTTDNALSTAAKKTLPVGIDNPAYTSCDFDGECVAVAPPTGCCDHGLKDAVNCEEVKSWNKANACTEPQICAHFVTLETRVAECNASNQCAMVYPADIACGGHVANPHECPSGWTCQYTGRSHRDPGVCVELTDAGL